MKIYLNGKEEVINEQTTLRDFLLSKGLELEKIIVEHNYHLVKQEDLANIILQENDLVEVLGFVGGG